jgi:putative hydrolase of the HAD superfamily
MLEAVLFDLDMTLVNFISFKQHTAKAAAKAMVKHGLPASENEAYGKIFFVYDAHGMEYEKTYFQVVSSYGLGINNAERIQQAAIVAHQKVMIEALRTYPMVLPTLAELRAMRLRLGLVSDGPRNKVWKRLVIAGLAPEFAAVVTHTDTGKYKPDPAPFLRAVELLGIEPGKILFVGDDRSRDIRGAREIGMMSCHAKYGSLGMKGYARYVREMEVEADFTINRFEELIGVAEGIGIKPDIDELVGKGKVSKLWRRGKLAVMSARTRASEMHVLKKVRK